MLSKMFFNLPFEVVDKIKILGIHFENNKWQIAGTVNLSDYNPQ